MGNYQNKNENNNNNNNSESNNNNNNSTTTIKNSERYNNINRYNKLDFIPRSIM